MVCVGILPPVSVVNVFNNDTDTAVLRQTFLRHFLLSAGVGTAMVMFFYCVRTSRCAAFLFVVRTPCTVSTVQYNRSRL